MAKPSQNSLAVYGYLQIQVDGMALTLSWQKNTGNGWEDASVDVCLIHRRPAIVPAQFPCCINKLFLIVVLIALYSRRVLYSLNLCACDILSKFSSPDSVSILTPPPRISVVYENSRPPRPNRHCYLHASHKHPPTKNQWNRGSEFFRRHGNPSCKWLLLKILDSPWKGQT